MVDAAGIETDCRPLHFAAQLAPVLGTDCDFKNESSLSISFIFFSLGMILSRKVATKSFQQFIYICSFPDSLCALKKIIIAYPCLMHFFRSFESLGPSRYS